MALEEKRNNVKYQGRDDYSVVYYDVLETGKKYFFLDGENGKLKNGNVIATTNLKIAINANKPEELAEIGVVNPDGQEVIPFTNKRVKAINEDVLLAEPVMPVSENVTKAIEDRSNPQEATRLVSAANTIKEKINSSMGPEGKYVFNDLFSEATIYDIDGNNLVNGEYYSFIGVNNDSLFLSKNDPESEVVTLPLVKEKVEDVVAEEPVAEETINEENIDVSEVQVADNVIDEAFNNETAENTVAEEAVEPVAENTEVAEETVEAPVSEEVTEEVVNEEPVAEETAATEENAVEAPEDTFGGPIETPMEEAAEEEAVAESTPENIMPPVAEDAITEEIAEPVSEENELTEDLIEKPMEEEVVQDELEESMPAPLEDIVDMPVEDAHAMVEEPMDQEVDLNIPQAEDVDLDDYQFANSEIKVDSIDRNDSFDDLIEEDQSQESEISEGTEIIEQMIDKVREQDNKIDSLESQLKEEKAVNKSAVKKVKEYEDKINSLVKELDESESKCNYFKRVAVTLADENKALKANLEDKNKLLDMLKEAKKLLNGEDDLKYDFGDDDARYSFDEDNNFRRVA